jgi:hypothetical protein
MILVTYCRGFALSDARKTINMFTTAPVLSDFIWLLPLSNKKTGRA